MVSLLAATSVIAVVIPVVEYIHDRHSPNPYGTDGPADS